MKNRGVIGLVVGLIITFSIWSYQETRYQAILSENRAMAEKVAELKLWEEMTGSNIAEVQDLQKQIEKRVLVYFVPGVSEDVIIGLGQRLVELKIADGFTYISETQAIADYQEANKDNPELLEFLEPGVLPASIQLSTNFPTMVKGYLEMIKEQEGIDEIR